MEWRPPSAAGSRELECRGCPVDRAAGGGVGFHNAAPFEHLRSTGGPIRVRSGYAVPTVAHLQYRVEPASTFCRSRSPGNDGEPLLLGTKLTACRLE